MKVNTSNAEHAIPASIICPEISELPLLTVFVDRRRINDGITLETTRDQLLGLAEWATR